MQSNPHILVVDDDPQVRRLLRRCFEPEGYRVSEAESRAQVMEAIEGDVVDLVTLDLHLGGEDGLLIARELRGIVETPIVMVTGKDDVIDRVVGLEIGADDYITKPFHLRELLARVRSVLRRSATAGRPAQTVAEPAAEQAHIFGNWSVDFDTREVRRDGKRVADFTSADFKLLEAFLKRPNRILTRDQLMDIVKGQEWSPYDRAIDNQIARLRKKIEDEPKEPRYLKTVRGEGYMFTPGGDDR